MPRRNKVANFHGKHEKKIQKFLSSTNMPAISSAVVLSVGMVKKNTNRKKRNKVKTERKVWLDGKMGREKMMETCPAFFFQSECWCMWLNAQIIQALT